MAVRFGLSFITAWLRSVHGLGYQRELRKQLFENLVYGPIDYIDRSGSDELLNSLITETSRAGGVLIMTFSIIETGFRGLIYLTVATVLAPLLTVVALIGLGISTLLVRYVLEPAYAVGDESADVNDRIQTTAQTTLQGIRDVQLFNMRSEMTERMQDALRDYLHVNVRLRRNQAALNNLNRFSNAMIVFALVYLGFRFTGLSIARLGVFLFAVFRLSPLLNQLNTKVYGLDGQLPHVIRIHRRLEDIASRTAPESTGDRSVDAVDSVEFDDISFAYEDNESVLHDVSFAVKRGEKVALVGPSGAGKSTVVSLLGRMYDPDTGQIEADGTPISEFDVTEWRDRLAVVRQEPFLFNGTLRENVTVGDRNASRRAVEEACEVACVTEFIPELPNGYETELGENGVRLSGGQKQRIAIARALLKDADVLVLDEATSELDSNIEREVYNRIGALEGQYATISIAHRLSTIEDADRIYTFVDGTITEAGTHAQLLDQDGAYANLYTTQT
jgi:subfamily B ATP-binding cassette protein MsbA